MNLNVLWIDSHIDDPSGSLYVSELKSISSLKLSLFKDVEEAINYMKSIEFQKTIVIVSGKLYSELVKKFKENIKDMHVAPKIIVFTADKEEFIDFKKKLEDELDCDVISDYTDYFIPYKYFYNSKMHLTEEGTEIRTRQLIFDLEKWGLVCTREEG